MIILYKFIEVVLKFIVLFIVISFERVVGFPVLFLTISMTMMLLDSGFKKYLLFVLASFLLATFYQLSFFFSLVVIALFYFSFTLGSQLLESNLNRFMSLLVVTLFVIAYFSGIEFRMLVIAQLVAELLLVLLFLLKFFLVSYGFLGAKSLTRRSFFR